MCEIFIYMCINMCDKISYVCIIYSMHSMHTICTSVGACLHTHKRSKVCAYLAFCCGTFFAQLHSTYTAPSTTTPTHAGFNEIPCENNLANMLLCVNLYTRTHFSIWICGTVSSSGVNFVSKMRKIWLNFYDLWFFFISITTKILITSFKISAWSKPFKRKYKAFSKSVKALKAPHKPIYGML